MPLINVAIVAVDGFSPFHYSVPASCLATRYPGKSALTSRSALKNRDS
ncbi:hypothetical protein L356_06596 [Enterobacter sp. MGH 10]|nr:hypothetical protein CSB67_0895 [Enterobacter hormaechei]EUM51434.1 hypothetical protein L361_03755 [Enterobacter sp. MGH 15]EUM79479.1 hypothetical protein L356_06596 [Enterobacter sp. MGH 10]EUM86797.1 hypothetical protein L352_08408 [Enterobacter sp. MGH 6]EUN02899.1 hypothetical protein L347_08307 [Enterobacter sp. MGH 1]CAA2940079.1 Uncharacterised protein [Enterobacter cloacae]